MTDPRRSTAATSSLVVVALSALGLAGCSQSERPVAVPTTPVVTTSTTAASTTSTSAVVPSTTSSAAPSPDPSEKVRTLTGPPTNVQTVVGVGGFAYFVTSAFGSIWISGKASGTVTRVDESTGEILATFPVSSQANRITATNTAIYVSGKFLTRIDPTDNTSTTIDLPEFSLAVIGSGEQVWATGYSGGVERIDSDGTVTTLKAPHGGWMDLAVSNGLVWALSQHQGSARVVAFDGQTGNARYDIPVTVGEPNSYPVRLVADERSVVVGIDTSGDGHSGELAVIDPFTGSITDRIALPARPEGIALTSRHIWTSGAVLDRVTLAAMTAHSYGFSIARASDGSIWGTSPGAALAWRWAPGDFGG